MMTISMKLAELLVIQYFNVNCFTALNARPKIKKKVTYFQHNKYGLNLMHIKKYTKPQLVIVK